jgi:Flp pilus assembly pilin Flp
MHIGLIKRFLEDEKGATAIAGIIGIGIVASLGTLKTGLNTIFNNVNTSLTK